MSKILYFDCFSGASGDMILGALIDAGLPIEELRAALGTLALNDVRVDATLVQRSGIAATNFRVTNGASSGGATNNQGQPVSAGVYLYSIEAGDFRQTKKMILLK